MKLFGPKQISIPSCFIEQSLLEFCESGFWRSIGFHQLQSESLGTKLGFTNVLKLQDDFSNVHVVTILTSGISNAPFALGDEVSNYEMSVHVGISVSTYRGRPLPTRGVTTLICTA